MKLLSIHVGRPTHHQIEGEDWYTGYVKEPALDRVWVGAENLEGDGQANLRVHGGPDRAVLGYSADHYDLWRAELAPLALPFGAFGENLTIAGCSEESTCLGDILQIGEAILQVSQPRRPCWKIDKRWGRTDLAAAIRANLRSGWYLRVLQQGYLEAGLPVALVERPYPEWTIARAHQAMTDQAADPVTARRLGACPALSADWRTMLSVGG